MDKKLFESKRTLFGDTQESLAAYLGKTVQTVNAKINGNGTWDQDEIRMIKNRYQLTPEEVTDIFLS